MRIAFLGLLLIACLSGTAIAKDDVLLIQNGPEGFVVWHTEGANNLPDDNILEIMATAKPEGGEKVPTSLGMAQAFEMPVGIKIRLLEATRDKAWLVDRDACGHIHLWHAEGETHLTDEELTEVVLSALPEGGKRIKLGDQYAKAFLGNLGVTVTLWKIPAKK